MKVAPTQPWVEQLAEQEPPPCPRCGSEKSCMVRSWPNICVDCSGLCDDCLEAWAKESGL